MTGTLTRQCCEPEGTGEVLSRQINMTKKKFCRTGLIVLIAPPRLNIFFADDNDLLRILYGREGVRQQQAMQQILIEV